MAKVAALALYEWMALREALADPAAVLDAVPQRPWDLVMQPAQLALDGRILRRQ